MGINGLLPLLKPIWVRAHVRDLRGRRCAVDAYSWLHKGAFAASREICLGIPTERHVGYCMQRVRMLLSYGVTPVLVFDGGVLPSKGEEEERRRRFRQESLAKALRLEEEKDFSGAFAMFQKAVDITPSIALQLIKALQREGVEFVVAPYEADAQMAYLCRLGFVDAVITEDSDLLAYGCPRVFFKMDRSGEAVEIRAPKIPCVRCPNFSSFTGEMVLEMCVLSGCDYSPSLRGIGPKKAHEIIRRFKTFQKATRHLRLSGVCMPPGFEDSFARAVLTFRHQLVFDPRQRQLVHLEPLPQALQGAQNLNLSFLGIVLEASLATGIAEGKVDPLTLKLFPEYAASALSPNLSPLQQQLEESRHFGVAGVPVLEQKRRLPRSTLPAQKNKLSKYFVPVSGGAKRRFLSPRPASLPAASASGPGHPPMPLRQDAAQGHISAALQSAPVSCMSPGFPSLQGGAELESKHHKGGLPEEADREYWRGSPVSADLEEEVQPLDTPTMDGPFRGLLGEGVGKPLEHAELEGGAGGTSDASASGMKSALESWAAEGEGIAIGGLGVPAGLPGHHKSGGSLTDCGINAVDSGDAEDAKALSSAAEGIFRMSCGGCPESVRPLFSLRNWGAQDTGSRGNRRISRCSWQEPRDESLRFNEETEVAALQGQAIPWGEVDARLSAEDNAPGFEFKDQSCTLVSSPPVSPANGILAPVSPGILNAPHCAGEGFEPRLPGMGHEPTQLGRCLGPRMSSATVKLRLMSSSKFFGPPRRTQGRIQENAEGTYTHEADERSQCNQQSRMLLDSMQLQAFSKVGQEALDKLESQIKLFRH